MSDHDGVFRRVSVHDWRHRPMSRAPQDDSYGPQLYIPAGCIVVKWRHGGQFL